jgi:hypothetical protein
MHLETLAGRGRSRTAARVFTATLWPIGSRPTAEAEICQTLPTIPRFHGPTRNRIPPALPAELIRQPHRMRAQIPTSPRDSSPVVRSEAGSTQSSHVATGRLDILFANSQFRHMLEWEDPTARSDELTKAGTER